MSGKHHTLKLFTICLNHFLDILTVKYNPKILIQYHLTTADRLLTVLDNSTICTTAEIEVVNDDGGVVIGDDKNFIEVNERGFIHGDPVIRYGTTNEGMEVFEFRLIGASDDEIFLFQEIN